MHAYANIFRALRPFRALEMSLEIYSFPEIDLSKIIPRYRIECSLLINLPEIETSSIWFFTFLMFRGHHKTLVLSG